YLVKLVAAQVAPCQPDLCDVAHPEIVQRPVPDNIKVLAVVETAETWLVEGLGCKIAPPAERAGTITNENIRRERQQLCSAQFQECGANSGLSFRQFRALRQSNGDQLLKRNRVGHDCGGHAGATCRMQ